MIETASPAQMLEGEHRETARVRCERLDCLRLVVGYITSRVDGARICLDCFRKEGRP